MSEVVRRQFAAGSATPVVILQGADGWWKYTKPAGVIVAESVEAIIPAIEAVERAVERESLTAAGYLAYEAAAAFGLATHPIAPDCPPLLWFGLFHSREPFEPRPRKGKFEFGRWHPSLDFHAYQAGVSRIKEAIAAGQTYQANYTFHLRAGFAGDTESLFAQLVVAQQGDYSAYIDIGRFVICSVSPELFFRLDGSVLESRPMKGTAKRGPTLDADRRQMDWLRASEKNRAENVMIVDMIRNDFGRVARAGTVRVPALFTVERYPTLLQMTSTVTAQTDAPLSEILAASFPCASITGAPKVRTMQILSRLESEPRGIYTGAIGAIMPGRKAQFNVAIRTAVIDRARGEAVYGVGSGVVWDSDAEAEYDECLLKARVLETSTGAAGDFHLLESMRWTPEEGFFLLDLHLERMAGSAEYFIIPFDRARAGAALAELAAGLAGPSKVRLLLDRRGEITLVARPLAEGAIPEPVRVGLAATPVSPDDVRLYHKTSRRDVYDSALASRPDCDDVVLWNTRGELTETTTSNLVLDLDGRRVTPPVDSGLLAGTYRAYLLSSGDLCEQRLTRDDLTQAAGIWLINSVRGQRQAILKS